LTKGVARIAAKNAIDTSKVKPGSWLARNFFPRFGTIGGLLDAIKV